MAMYLRTRHDSYDRREGTRREERSRASPGDLNESSRLAGANRVWHERYLENRKEGMWVLHAAARATFSTSMMEPISRLILHISKPYSVADIMVAVALAGRNLFRAVRAGKTLTEDGGPIVVLATIVSLAGIARSAVLTGKNAEACFALVAMTLTPLSPTAGGAITLLVSAWLETSLTGARTAGQRCF